MIDVFERLAPAYGRVVRKLALDVWYDRANVNEFLKRAEFFKKRYTAELMEYFRGQDYVFNPKRIKELSDRWLADQLLITRKLRTIADLKKGKLIEELDEPARKEAIELYEQAKIKPEGRAVRVVSFADNLEARAMQLGEDAAFDLGRDLNHDTVSANSDIYEWSSQEDAQVRKTHRILNGKKFSYHSPPTTIDKDGRKHTGNCGSDWGCRCFEKAATGRPLINFIARE